MFKKLIISATFFSSLGMANTLGFNPQYAEEGVPVHFTWAMVGQWTACQVTGLPGGTISRLSGSITIDPVNSINASVNCFKFDPLSNRVVASASETYKFEIEPTITIDYPDGVYSDDAWPLKLTYKNAASCSYRYDFPAMPGSATPYKSFTSPFTQRTAFGNQGAMYEVKIEVKCINDVGREKVQSKRVYVSPKPTDITVPKIKRFTHGDIVFGRTGLFWSTEYVTSCTLTGKGITANVPNNAFDYKVDVPVGDTVFTLRCQKDSSNTVSKSITVRRTASSGGGPCIDCGSEILSHEVSMHQDLNSVDEEIVAGSKHLERRIVSLNDIGDSVLLELNKSIDTLDVYILNNESGDYDFSHRIIKFFDLDDVDYITFDEISRKVSVVTK